MYQDIRTSQPNVSHGILVMFAASVGLAGGAVTHLERQRDKGGL